MQANEFLKDSENDVLQAAIRNIVLNIDTLEEFVIDMVDRTDPTLGKVRRLEYEGTDEKDRLRAHQEHVDDIVIALGSILGAVSSLRDNVEVVVDSAGERTTRVLQ
jgi:hypothetical protein